MTKLTKDEWEKRKEKFSKILAFLPNLASQRGKKIPCSMKCGRMVARSIIAETSESSGKVSSKFPKDWRRVTDEQKRELAGMTDSEIANEVGFTLKSAQNWIKDLIAQGYRK